MEKRLINRLQGYPTIYMVFLGLALLLGRGCNALWNNRYFENEGSKTNSHSTGTFGHKEYTKYDDNSVDLKIYPNFVGHRLESSRLGQDLDGNDLVDKIRVNSPEWKLHRLKKVLTRNNNYVKHKNEFDEFDKLLTEEKERFLKKQRKYEKQ